MGYSEVYVAGYNGVSMSSLSTTPVSAPETNNCIENVFFFVGGDFKIQEDKSGIRFPDGNTSDYKTGLS